MAANRLISRTMLGLCVAAFTGAAWADDEPQSPPASQGRGGSVTATQPPESGPDATTRDSGLRDTDSTGSTTRGSNDTGYTHGARDMSTRGTATRYQGRYHGCRASKLIGSNVVNPEGKDLGKIEDVAIDPDSGRVAYAVLSFGGFLGIGDKYFAIPWQSLKFGNQDDEKITLAVEKSQLENAKGFDKDNWPDMANEQWARQTHTSFGAEPYWESLTGDQAQTRPQRVVRLSELQDEQVKNSQGEQLGDIDEIVLDSGRGQVAYAVIGSGGFLDIGEELVAVPWKKLNVQDKDTIRMDVAKDQLTAGPRINNKQWPRPTDDVYLIEVYRFYNVAPYWEHAVNEQNRISDAGRNNLGTDRDNLGNNNRNDTDNMGTGGNRTGADRTNPQNNDRTDRERNSDNDRSDRTGERNPRDNNP